MIRKVLVFVVAAASLRAGLALAQMPPGESGMGAGHAPGFGPGPGPGPAAGIPSGGPPEGGIGPVPGPVDPIERNLFPPEMILGHADELGLTEAQRSFVRNAVRDVQKKFIDLQFDLQERGEKVGRLLKERPIDEAKVGGVIDEILGLEGQIKKLHLGMLIRIKNQLTTTQIEELGAHRP